MKTARIVIGSCYGDEGKGTIVAKYAKASENVLNVLTNGGSQRGHSIVTDKGSHTFHHFGSGTYFGAANYYSSFFILNPIQFCKEYHELVVKPKVYVDSKCRWSTPFDAISNSITEELLGRHASCRMGIWNTVTRYKASCFPALQDFVCMPLNEQLSIMTSIKKYYESKIHVTKKWYDIWNNVNLIFHFLDDCKFMVEHTEVIYDNFSELKAYDNVIFENGQGLLLSDTGRDSLDTTPSCTGIGYSRQILAKLGVDEYDVTAHYVTRPYLTRHGDGHLDEECNMGAISSHIREDRTNLYNDAQGKFRYGRLDIDKLKDRIDADANGCKYFLEVTHCDEMDRSKEFRSKFKNVNLTDKNLI